MFQIIKSQSWNKINSFPNIIVCVFVCEHVHAWSHWHMCDVCIGTVILHVSLDISINRNDIGERVLKLELPNQMFS